MKVAFAGTPAFAAEALKAVLAAGYSVPLVLTQPDRPAGRGMGLQTSAVKQVALSNQLSIFQPESLKAPEQQVPLAECHPDVLVVAAYGLLLPQAVLDIPRYGCINIHASLLPRWRGAAPIQRAIEAGDENTGITIMQMEKGLDTGPMLLIKTLPILSADTTSTLHDRLAILGAQAIIEALSELEASTLTPREQPVEGVTYAHKIDKSESSLDFKVSAIALCNKLRAFDPFPGGAAEIRGQQLKIWAASVENGSATPGKVVDLNTNGIIVGTGEGLLCLKELQKPGAKRLPAPDFLRGFEIQVGDQFKVN